MNGLPEFSTLVCGCASLRASAGSWPDCACTVPSFPDGPEGLVPFSLLSLWHWDGPESNLAAEEGEEAGCAPETIAAVGDWCSAMPWRDGSCQAERGQLCRGWKLAGQERNPEVRGLCACLLFVLPHAVSFPSPRKIKKNRRGEGSRGGAVCIIHCLPPLLS